LDEKTSIRLIERHSSSVEEDRSPLIELPSTSLSTPLPQAEFGGSGVARGRGRVLAEGRGVVEELRRVYEERCRIVRTQEPRRREGGGKGAVVSRGGMGIGIGRVS
jgi:hypothetical protein